MGRKRDLNDDLYPWIGMSPAIRDTVATLTALARSYARIQERWTSEEMSAETTARLETRETRLEEQIAAMVDTLPAPDLTDDRKGTWAVRFEGDPRGWTVALLVRSGQDVVSELGVDR